jgi:hypothetical protein
MKAPSTRHVVAGQVCELSSPSVPLVRNVYALSIVDAEPGHADPVALWTLAHRLARELAEQAHGDPECFTLLFNAARTRRKPWPHVHIILARSPTEKRWVLLCLSLKVLLRWRRWPGIRALVQRDLRPPRALRVISTSERPAQ